MSVLCQNRTCAGAGTGTVVGTRNQCAVIDDCLIQHGYKLTASGT